MSDPKAPDVGGQLHELTATIHNNFPKLAGTLNAQLGPNAQANYSANANIAPQQQGLQAALYAAYAPYLNSIGQGMSSSNQAAQLGANANLTGSPDAQRLTSNLNNLQQGLDPQFYALRNQIGTGMSNLLNTIGDPNKLSGGESANIERNLNRLNVAGGNYGNRSPLNTINNAMTFGQGLQNKQAFQSGLFGQAGSTAQGLKSGFNAQDITMGQPFNNQFGGNQLTGVNNNPIQQPADLLGSMFGGGTGMANNNANINANRRDVVDRINGAISSC